MKATDFMTALTLPAPTWNGDTLTIHLPANSGTVVITDWPLPMHAGGYQDGQLAARVTALHQGAAWIHVPRHGGTLTFQVRAVSAEEHLALDLALLDDQDVTMSAMAA